ncbi:hypothetical protein PAMA_002501 [Pampus argenteus]
MFRISLIVCIALIFGITAKPYKPWNKLRDEAYQDVVMSVNAAGKVSWEVEVEPPQNMDETLYNIDPNMMIWKSMTGSGQQKHHLKAEEDLDELHHPSVADLLKLQNHDFAADIQSEPLQEAANTKYNQVPEEDKDDINHPDFSNVVSDETEQDHKARYELQQYHHDRPHSPVQMEPQRHEARVHLQPEEDRDDFYHAGLQQPIAFQHQAEAAAPADWSSERKHSEPEEDRDDLYHR